jgi:tetratricopeptide (TPR) repeat protein
VPEAAILDMAIDGQTLRGYSAIELFVLGAQQVRPDFELRAEDLVHVAHICCLVQGTPLAILLAAAWVEMLAPEEIAREIQHSLDFLETDLRDVPSRQRSIRAAFEYSWHLLDEDEQEMFRGLSVFCGGFTRKAAQEIVGASLRDLMSLVNKSLLLPSSPGRYELHELLRQYGADRLDQVPEQAETVRSRHCAYYAAALEGWADELKGPRQRQAATEMDLEVENGRAAWRWAADHHHVECLARAADGIWLYHTRRMRYEEGEAAFRVGVGSLEGAQGDGVLRLRARMLILWSHFLLELGKKDPALETIEEGWALLHELEQAGEDVRSEIALAVLHQARITRYYSTDPLEAKEQYEKGVALYEELGDRWGLAQALSALGWIAEHLGNYAWAEELSSRSLAIRRELGDQRGMADAMLNLGIIAWVQGRLDEADSLLRESVGIFRALDDWNRVARTLKDMGEVLVRRGLFEDGLAIMEGSLDIYEDLGYQWGSSDLVPFLAEAHVHLGHYGQARARAERGVVLCDKGKHLWGVALARQSVVEAMEIGTELGAFMPVLYSLPVAALLLAGGGAIERAVEVYACAMSYPFLANSRWFQDLVAGPLAAAGGRLPVESAAAARERGQAQDWQTMAATLPAEL